MDSTAIRIPLIRRAPAIFANVESVRRCAQRAAVRSLVEEMTMAVHWKAVDVEWRAARKGRRAES